MIASHKIIKNTFAMYSQTIISIFVGLFSTRFVLASLGIDDFGIYGLVGSIVVWLSFLNGSMASATQRFLSYHREKDDVQTIFSNTIIVHFCIGIIFVLGIELIGFLFLDELNIPLERKPVAHFLLHCSVLSTFFSVISTPYSALINAKENMSFISICSIFFSFCQLGIAIILAHISFDKLKFYGVMLAFCVILDISAKRIFCAIKYKKIKFNMKYMDKIVIKKMLSFSAWNFLDSVTSIIKFQGMPFLLNLFFGVALNATYTIANQVLAKVSSFSWNLMTAASPQIVSGIAEHNLERSKQLAISACKISFFLVSLFSVPLILNMNFILELWLVQVPKYASSFCIIVLLIEMLNNLCRGLDILVEAKGNISIFKCFMGLANLIAFPIAYVLLKIGNSPYSIFAGLAASALFVLIIRAYFAKFHTNISLLNYLFEILKVVFLICIVFIMIYFLHFNNEMTKLILTTLLSSVLLCCGLWFVLNEREKNLVKSIANKILPR